MRLWKKASEEIVAPVNTEPHTNDPGECKCQRCTGLRAGRIRPETFAEYMVTPARIGQRKAMIAMMDEHKLRSQWSDEKWNDYLDRLGRGEVSILPGEHDNP